MEEGKARSSSFRRSSSTRGPLRQDSNSPLHRAQSPTIIRATSSFRRSTSQRSSSPIARDAGGSRRLRSHSSSSAGSYGLDDDEGDDNLNLFSVTDHFNLPTTALSCEEELISRVNDGVGGGSRSQSVSNTSGREGSLSHSGKTAMNSSGGGASKKAQQRIQCACQVGSYIWIIDRSSTITIVDISTGAISKQLDSDKAFATPLDKSKGRMVIGDAMNPDKLKTKADHVTCAIAVRNETEVWMGGNDGKIHVFDAKRCKKVAELKKHVGAVQCLHYDSPSQLVFSGGSDFKVISWRTLHESSFTATTAPEHTSTNCMRQLSFKTGLSKEEEEELQHSKQYVRGVERIFSGHRLYVNAVDTDGTGLMVSGCSDGVLCLWNIHTGSCLSARKLHHNTSSTSTTTNPVNNSIVSDLSTSTGAESFSSAITHLTFCTCGGVERVAAAINEPLEVLWFTIECSVLVPSFTYSLGAKLRQSQLRILSLRAHGDMTFIFTNNDQVHLHHSNPSAMEVNEDGRAVDGNGGLVGIHSIERRSMTNEGQWSNGPSTQHPAAASVVVAGRAYTSFAFASVGNFESTSVGTPLPLSVVHWSGYTRKEAAATGAMKGGKRADSAHHTNNGEFARGHSSNTSAMSPSTTASVGNNTTQHYGSPQFKRTNTAASTASQQQHHDPESKRNQQQHTNSNKTFVPRAKPFYNHTAVADADKLRAAMDLLDEERDKRDELKNTVRTLYGGIQQLKAKLAAATIKHHQEEVSELLAEFKIAVELQNRAASLHGGSSTSSEPQESKSHAQPMDAHLVRIMSVTLATLGYDVPEDLFNPPMVEPSVPQQPSEDEVSSEEKNVGDKEKEEVKADEKEMEEPSANDDQQRPAASSDESPSTVDVTTTGKEDASTVAAVESDDSKINTKAVDDDVENGVVENENHDQVGDQLTEEQKAGEDESVKEEANGQQPEEESSEAANTTAEGATAKKQEEEEEAANSNTSGSELTAPVKRVTVQEEVPTAAADEQQATSPSPQRPRRNRGRSIRVPGAMPSQRIGVPAMTIGQQLVAAQLRVLELENENKRLREKLAVAAAIAPTMSGGSPGAGSL